MAQENPIVGKIPEFTEDSPVPVRELEEVKQPTEVIPPEEKETPEPPAEKPAAPLETGEDTQEPLQEVTQPNADSEAVKGLQEERVKLLKEISELRGQRREIKQEQLASVEKQIDDLKDLHPEDITVIDRVLRSKGYVTKAESQQMFHEAVKQEELNKFLERYPEYRPENDPQDVNWSTLQRELGFYRLPGLGEDPHKISEILDRAHKAISKVVSGRAAPTEIKRQQVKTASIGGGGAQRSPSSGKTLSQEQRDIYRRGGWSEEEIREIESGLSE